MDENHAAPSGKAALATCPRASTRESADDYAAIVAQLNEKWRVIECRQRIQWILQKRDGYRAGRPRWTGQHYCRTSDVLLRLCRTLCAPVDPTAVIILDMLPEWFGSTSPAGCLGASYTRSD